MSSLLPPIVIGPVSVYSTDVRVDGPLPGSNVHLLVNGVSKIQATATSTTTYVPLAGAGLNGGDKLTARWYLGNEASDPTPVPEVVLDAPSKLGPLVYLSQVHNCVDWILLGGAYPGAWVEIYNGSTQIGAEIAKGDVVAVRITGDINRGDVLEAVQSVKTPSSKLKQRNTRYTTHKTALEDSLHYDPLNSLLPTRKSIGTPSLPAEWLPGRDEEKVMPSPSIGPVPGCSQAVPISGLLQGASTHLASGSDVLHYPFVGGAFWALLGREAHPPESFTASQHFERCGGSSPSSSPPVPVDKDRPLRKPDFKRHDIECPALQAIVVTNLEPGAVVTFKIVGPSGTTVIGRIGVGQGVSWAQFWLPDLSTLVPHAPPYAALVAMQEFCGQSAQSDPVYFSAFGTDSFPPYIYEPVVECANYVQLNSFGVVRIYSDQADSPVISAPTYTGGQSFIKTYRGLRAGEHITAKLETSCQPPDMWVSPAVQVQRKGEVLSPKVLEPIRVFHTWVWLKDVVSGGQVHVFVNDNWRATAPAAGAGGASGVVMVYVGSLKPEDKITALQTICTTISDHEPAVTVTFGQMKVWSEPVSLVQDVPASVTIKAVDVDNNSPVSGTVSLGGNVVGVTNKPIAVSPTQTALNFSVSATGYTTETLAVPVTPSTSVKPAMLTIVTGLGFNASKKSITEITWNLLGPSNSFTKTEKPNTNPAAVQFALPKPSSGFTRFTLSCLVKFEYENFNLISGANGKGSSDSIAGGISKPSPSTIELDWNGTDTMANFTVEWIQSLDIFVVQFFGTS